MNKLREALIAIQLEHETSYYESAGSWNWSCKCGLTDQFVAWDDCHKKTREHWADVIIAALAAEPTEQARLWTHCPFDVESEDEGDELREPHCHANRDGECKHFAYCPMEAQKRALAQPAEKQREEVPMHRTTA